MTAFMIVRLPSHSKALDAVEFMHSNNFTYRISTNIPLMNFLLSSGGGESRQPGVFQEFEPGKEEVHVIANMTCIFPHEIKVEANSTENSRPNENPVPNQRVIKEEVDTSTVDQPVDRNPRLEIFSVASESVEPREISSAAPLNPPMDVGQAENEVVNDHQEEEINSSLNQVENIDGMNKNVLLVDNQEFDENHAEIPIDIPMDVTEQEAQAVYLVEAQQTAEEHEEANFFGENEGVGDEEQTEDVEEGDVAVDEPLEPCDADASTVTHRPIHNDDLLFDFEDSLNDDLQMEKNVMETEDDEEKDMEEDEKLEEFQEDEEELVEEQEHEVDKMEEDLKEKIDENGDGEDIEQAEKDSDDEEEISDEEVDANSDQESDEEKATQKKKKKKIGRPTGNSIGRRLFTCLAKNCSSSYKSFEELEEHMEIHTGRQEFFCDVCKKKFSSKAAAMVHIQRKKKKECCACGKKFSYNCYLIRHYRSHTGEKPFVCKTCGKGFSVLITLKNHMLTHTGEKPFPCGICKKRFPLKSHLKKHERTHTGEKPFKCKDCGKRFNQGSNLNVHMRIHTGQKPFSCNKCDAKFARKDYLKYHMKKNHQ